MPLNKITKNSTAIFAGITVVVMIGYDMLAAAAGYEWTFTAFIRFHSRYHPSIPFACGLLLGGLLAKAKHMIDEGKV